MTGARTIGWHYEASASRLDALLRPLDVVGWERAVPGCPGWRVRDVLAHLVGNTEDAAAGRLAGVPDEEQTAEQIDRHRDDDPVALLDAWLAVVPFVGAVLTETERWPGAIDALTHEHDVRHALGDRGARDHESIEALAELLVPPIEAPRPLRVDLGDRVVATAGGEEGAPITLRATAFEVVRLRLGRRSLDQVRAMDWSDDPADVLPHLFVFGPTPHDLDE